MRALVSLAIGALVLPFAPGAMGMHNENCVPAQVPATELMGLYVVSYGLGPGGGVHLYLEANGLTGLQTGALSPTGLYGDDNLSQTCGHAADDLLI